MQNRRLPQLTAVSIETLGVFLFFALTFALPSGYSYGATVLLLGGLVYVAKRPAMSLSAEDKAIAWVLTGYFLVSLLSILYLQNNTKSLDQSLRCLLAVPILLWMLHVRFHLAALWAATVLGIVSSVGIAVWQLYGLGYDRAEGYLNIIHFGNIALIFGVFCLGGLFWAGTQGRKVWWWRAAFVLGIACSLYSVIASGSRGSWVAMPAIALLFCVAFIDRRNAARAAVAGAVVAIVVAGLFMMPDSRLKARYDAAVSDIALFLKKDEADTSIGARFVMWDGAIENIAKKPWLGWNEQEYADELQRMVDAGVLDEVALKFTDNLHNNYLQAWAFQGLPGLLALLALYAVPLAGFCRRLRHADITVRTLAFCGSSLVAGYVFFGLTQVILRRNNGIMFLVLTLVILWAAMRYAEAKGSDPIRGRTPG
ncbi:O-antigen ligase family protein [Alcaligenaceae bacterium]|nr:O-antigen ligase family protein [Alcaligenaceae bacterium]